MNKKSILKIALILLLFILIGFSIFKLANAPILCWDSWDEVNNHPIGGCEPYYGLAIQELILPFVIWLVIFVITLLLHFKIKE